MGKYKARFRAWVLRMMFTPVRALTLSRAKIRPGEKLTTVHGGYTFYQHSKTFGAHITLHYIGASDCECFDYKENELDLFRSERQVLEGLVTP